MDSYLMMLYVTLEQESALKTFFIEQGWTFCKPDLAVLTDRLGPATTRLSMSIAEDEHNDQPQKEQSDKDSKTNMQASKVSTEHMTKQHVKRKSAHQEQNPVAPKQAKVETATCRVQDADASNKAIESSQLVEIKIEKDCLDTDSMGRIDDLKDEGIEDKDRAVSDVDGTNVLPRDNAAPVYIVKRSVLQQIKSEPLEDEYNPPAASDKPQVKSKVGGLTRTSLVNKVKNNAPVEVRKEKTTLVLTEEEKKKVTAHLVELSKLGYGYSREQISRQALYYAIELGKKKYVSNPLGSGWVRKYVESLEEENQVKSFVLSTQQKLSTNKRCVSHYYNKLNGIFKEYNLGNTPENVYLMDEVDIPGGDKRSAITIIGAGNAAGQTIPLHFVMVTGILNEDHYMVRRCQLATQGFKNYLRTHFIKYANWTGNENNYKLVLYDAHTTLLSVELVQWASRNRILLFPMPPHSSHIIENGCEGVFQPIRTRYQEKYGGSIPGKDVASLESVSVLKVLYEATVTYSALEKAFSSFGIYPLQQAKVMCDHLKRKAVIS